MNKNTRMIQIDKSGTTIPVTVQEKDGKHVIDIDGVVWVETENKVHAAVLFNMICDHITEYVSYKAK